jgi:hypothetical protein
MSPYIGVYPAPELPDHPHGVYPVDFILESIITAGLKWIVTDPNAGKLVFGHYLEPWLAKYGQPKIDEIIGFMKKYPVKVVQHWSMIATNSPCFSIQILDAGEEVAKTGLQDHAREMDVMGANDELLERRRVSYAPITDSIHIGIHNALTPDLTKYLYQFLVYILNTYKPSLENMGMELGTFRATDISRLNDYLPENMYSRFITFTISSMPTFDMGTLPLITDINLQT